jgi:ABC-2 type transport system permease protein
MKIQVRKPKIQMNFMSLGKFFVTLGTKTIAQLLVLIVVLIAINILSQKIFFRWDLTQTKTYSLGNGTKNILSNLDDTVTIKVFFSENIPPDMVHVTQDVKDIYEEYARYAGGNIVLEIKNPKDENFDKDATAAGIPQVRFSELSSDKFQIAQGYLGASIQYKDQKEAIEMITDVKNLEYDTSSRIYKLTHKDKAKIGFLTGQGESDSNFSGIKKLLESQFTVETVSIVNGQPIDPNTIKVLIIAAPTLNFSERDKFEIDQYVMNGGRIIALINLYDLDYQNPVINKTNTNINEILKPYGAEIASSVILDESFMPLVSGYQQIAYPYWVLVQGDTISKDNPALDKLESLIFFWTSPINDTTTEGQTFIPLVKSSNKAWEKTGDTINVDIERFVPGDEQQFVLAALLEGKETSLFKGKDIPKLDGTEDKRPQDSVRKDETDDARIVIIGDSDFASDQFLGGSDQNGIFVTNLVEWLASSDDLMAIRSKNISERSLEVVSEGEKTTTKIGIVSAMPLLVITGGIVYTFIRRKRKSSI